MDQDLQLLLESTKGRGAFYEYLSLVFSRPPDESFKGISAKVYPFIEAYANETGNGLIADGVKDLAEYIHIEKESDEMMILDMLNNQYTNLFLLGMNSIPPMESVFLSPDHLIKQEPWEKVMAYYHIRGFKKPPFFKETEDHISMELLFMSQMCELAVRLPEEGDTQGIWDVFKEQLVFLDEHMLKWVPKLAEAITAKQISCDIPLYKAATKILNGFLGEDRRFLQELVSIRD